MADAQESIKFTLFAAQQLADIYLQTDARLDEARTGKPAMDLTVPTLNVLRPDYAGAPGLATASSFLELGNAYLRASVLVARALQGGTHFHSADQESFYNHIAANILTPANHYYFTTGTLGGPFLYHKDTGFERGMAYAYGAYHLSRAAVLPLEAQQIQTPWLQASGCTAETAERFDQDPAQGYGVGECDEFQEDNSNAVDWLTSSNDEPDAEDEPALDDNLPQYDLMTSTLWITDQWGAAFSLGEQLNGTTAYFQAIEGRDGPQIWQIALGSGALLATQWGLAQASSQPLDTERLVTAPLVAGLSATQAWSTDNRHILAGYANNNLLIGVNRFIPDANAMAHDLNPADNSFMASSTESAGFAAGVGLHSLGGLSLGVYWPGATGRERLALALTAGAAHSLLAEETTVNLLMGHKENLWPALAGVGGYWGSVGLGATLGQGDGIVGKGLRFIASNMQMGTTAHGIPVLALNGEW